MSATPASDHASTLRGLAGGVFRGLHEAEALEAGAAALEAAARPAPKVLAEAWGLRDRDGCDLRLWATEAEAGFAACEGHRVVCVHVVEVPS